LSYYVRKDEDDTLHESMALANFDFMKSDFVFTKKSFFCKRLVFILEY